MDSKTWTARVLVRDTCYRDADGELKVDTHVFEVVNDVVEFKVGDGVILVMLADSRIFVWPLSNVLRYEMAEDGVGE